MHTCPHTYTTFAGACKLCGMMYCRDCGSPQVVTVEKHEFKDWPGGYSQAIRHVKEMWPLCHACAAKMPPVYVEPAPPPPMTITTVPASAAFYPNATSARFIDPSIPITVSNKTNPVDWTEAIKLLDALKLPAYAGFPKEPTRGAAFEYGVYGKSPVQKLLKQEQAKQPKPPKPKRTPQSVLEADVEQFLREQDDD